VAEIRIERKQRSILPLIIGLVLLVLVIWGLSKVRSREEAGDRGRGAAATDALRDDTPPRLRQYARAAGAEEPALFRAAAS
jgi:Na+-transporting methylmalonyl-CoA/oxaloacetate decarboxylase gamma subunit